MVRRPALGGGDVQVFLIHDTGVERSRGWKVVARAGEGRFSEAASRF